jgi:hypothetical protein
MHTLPLRPLLSPLDPACGWHALAQVLHKWAPETTGLVLTASGKQLHNWPLHAMTEHVPEQMRFLKKECNLVFAWTCTQVCQMPL